MGRHALAGLLALAQAVLVAPCWAQSAQAAQVGAGAIWLAPKPGESVLHPEGSFNASKDIIDRLLLDNMQDEVFI